MGNWIMVVQGIGPHHNNKPYDADEFLRDLIRHMHVDGNQKIMSATIYSGGATHVPVMPLDAQASYEASQQGKGASDA